MTTTLARWRDVFAPFEAGFGLLPFVDADMRIEQFVQDGKYIVRAEVPGVDPDKDIEVTVADGVLKIHASRTAEKRERVHTEFHYGSLMRAVTLPAGAAAETASAKYAKGILEISFAMGEPRESEHRIAIEVAKEPNGKAKK